MGHRPGGSRRQRVTGVLLGLAITATIAAAPLADGSANAAPVAQSALTTSRAAAIHLRRILVGGMPDSVAVDPRSGAAWVATGPLLVRISEATQRVTARITMNPGIRSVAVDPRTRTVWALGCGSSCALIAVSEATNRIVHRLTNLGGGRGLAIDQRTGLIWFATVDAGGHPVVQAVSEASRRIVRTIRLHFDRHHQSGGITVDPRSGTVWVSVIPADPRTSIAWVSEISESSSRVVHVYSHGMPGTTDVITAIDSARGTVWADFGSFRLGGTIEVIDIAGHRTVRTMSGTPAAPDGLAIDSRAGIVVASGGVGDGHQDTVLLISESSGKILHMIPAGLFPARLAVDARTGNVYVPIDFKGVVQQFRL